MTSNLTKLAKRLRVSETEAERILWQNLRAKQTGLKFRRQEPIGRYIVDFVFYPAKLVLEIDGGQHADAAHTANDLARDIWLQQQGFTVLRFWNNDIMENVEGVWDRISIWLSREKHPPQPLPSREGRRQ